MKDTIKPAKKLEKRERLKNYQLETVNKLSSLDLNSLYPDNWISRYGHTKKDIQRIIEKLKKCNADNEYLDSEQLDIRSGEVQDRYKAIKTDSCKQFSICPICASTKRNKVIEHIKPYIKVLTRIPGIYVYNGTITIQGTKDPGNDYERLRSSWTRFIKRGQRRKFGKRSKGEASKFLGSLLSVEIIPEAKDPEKYHVHGHLLIVTNKPLNYTVYDPVKKAALNKKYGSRIPKKELDKAAIKRIDILNNENEDLIYKDIAVSKLSEEWYKSSGAINFWVYPMKDRIIDGEYKKIDSQLYEVIKYECKPWELQPERLIAVWDSLHGKRRITFSGIFTNNKYYKTCFKKLLEHNNLLNYFKEFKLDYNEETKVNYYFVKRETFDWKTWSYQTAEERTDQTYRQQPEYKEYQRKKMIIINSYRTEINRHKKNLFTARQLLNNPLWCPAHYLEGEKDISDHSRRAWIKRSEEIYTEHCKLIREETNSLKSWIRQYLEKKQEFIKPDLPPLKDPKWYLKGSPELTEYVW